MLCTYRHTRRSCHFGYLTQGIVNNLAPLLFTVFQDQYAVSFGQLSQLIVLNFGTQVCMDFFSVWCVDRIGIRRCALAAHLLAAVGLIGMGVLPQVMAPFPGLCIAMVCSAMGSGLIEDLVSPILDGLPVGEAAPPGGKAASMALLHSFCCWGQVAVVLCTTLALHVFGSAHWFLLPLFWALVPLMNLFYLAKVPLPPPLPPEQKTPIHTMLRSRLFWLCLVLMLCAGAAELTMSQWSSLFAERSLGMEKVWGDLFGPCLFAALQGMGRMLYGIYGKRFDLRRALLLSASMCTACYLVTALTHTPLLALLSCAMCGLSVSLMWPGLYSLSARAFPRGGTSMFGMMAVCGDIGCTLGPWLVGTLAGLSGDGMQGGLLAGAAFPLLMAGGLLCIVRRSVRRYAKRTTVKIDKSDEIS